MPAIFAEKSLENKEIVMPKKFHLGDILSITTGALVSPNHMEGIYQILNFMTGDNLFTHQLPRASRQCEPYLVKQLPWLSEISAEDVNEKNWESWLAKKVEKYGEFHEITPIPTSEYKYQEPIKELQQMTSAKIVIIETD